MVAMSRRAAAMSADTSRCCDRIVSRSPSTCLSIPV